MRIKFVDLQRQNRSLKKELMSVIEKTVDEADFIMGKTLEKFENSFAKFCDKKYAVGVNSGTDALKLALLAYGIKNGVEVITVPNSYFSTAMVISEIGATPVFVDIDTDTYTMNVELLEKAISKKTKAIIPVHLYGHVADMDPILRLARKYKLAVIEDACQAHGAMYKGKKVPYGETGAFSFYPGKNIGCFGDGGALVTDSKKVADKILYLRNDGSLKKYIHKVSGIKSRLDALQAAILSMKLHYLEQWNKKRYLHAMKYNQLLGAIPGITTPRVASYASHAYHIYCIECRNRDKLWEYLKNKGVEAQIHYPLPIHLQDAYKNKKYKKGSFPVTEEKAQTILSLPMFPELTDREVGYVCSVINEFVNAS
jgi:dTDP-4-amino-4,6-dideoxygalactose transaminase